MSLNDFADRIAGWVAARIPDDTIEWRGLVLAEETGELCRCIVKMQAGLRGTRQEWMHEMRVEVGDVFFALQALCNSAGIDLHQAVEDRWKQVEHIDARARRLPSQAARDAVLADLIEYFSDPVICAEYWAAGPPDIAEAIRDYAYRIPQAST